MRHYQSLWYLELYILFEQAEECSCNKHVLRGDFLPPCGCHTFRSRQMGQWPSAPSWSSSAGPWRAGKCWGRLQVLVLEPGGGGISHLMGFPQPHVTDPSHQVNLTAVPLLMYCVIATPGITGCQS
jgi:hypothetical protein